MFNFKNLQLCTVIILSLVWLLIQFNSLCSMGGGEKFFQWYWWNCRYTKRYKSIALGWRERNVSSTFINSSFGQVTGECLLYLGWIVHAILSISHTLSNHSLFFCLLQIAVCLFFFGFDLYPMNSYYLRFDHKRNETEVRKTLCIKIWFCMV